MVGTCSTHWLDEKCVKTFVVNPEGKRALGRPSVNGRIILKWILRKDGGSV
jgi:hypothetical protein